MQFKDFYKLSEATFSRSQISRQKLTAPTTLRRVVEGWELWFRDNISELSPEVRNARKILHALDDRNLSKDILDKIAVSVKKSLSRSNKLSFNKFEKASRFYGGHGLPREAIHTDDKKARSKYVKFAKWTKTVPIDTLTPEIQIQIQSNIHKLARVFILRGQEDAEQAYQAVLDAIINRSSGIALPIKRIGRDIQSDVVQPHRGTLVYKHIQSFVEANPKRKISDDFENDVRNYLYKDLFNVIQHIVSGFQQYHTNFKDDEIVNVMKSVKDVLNDSIVAIIDDLHNQFTQQSVSNFSLKKILINKASSLIDGYINEDQEKFTDFVRKVRMSRRDITKDTTMDGFAYYVASKAVEILKDVFDYETKIKAGKDTDEHEFEQWMEKAIENTSKVIRTLQSIGVRKFARIPIIFEYQDWGERWYPESGFTVGGLHHLGPRRQQKIINPATQKPYFYGPTKHSHYIQIYSNDIGTIAHEVGHNIYYRLPDTQQAAVKELATTMPSPSSYGSPKYQYPGTNQPGKAHQSGNEWFAEMLNLLISNPALLNSPIRASRHDFTIRGKAILGMPDKPQENPNKQVKDLNLMVARFKQAFATQDPHGFVGYKDDKNQSTIRLPKRLRQYRIRS